MKDFLSNGGGILAMSGEGGEQNLKTNLNFLLEEYGIMINAGMVHVHSECQTTLFIKSILL